DCPQAFRFPCAPRYRLPTWLASRRPRSPAGSPGPAPPPGSPSPRSGPSLGSAHSADRHGSAPTRICAPACHSPSTLGSCRGGAPPRPRPLLPPPIILLPVPEAAPARIRAGLGPPAVLDEVADLQVFQGHQVARRDERVRLRAGEILALPLEVPRGPGQGLSR